MFQSALGNMCLDVPGGITSDGTALQLWDCNGNAWQQSQLHPLRRSFGAVSNVK